MPRPRRVALLAALSSLLAVFAAPANAFFAPIGDMPLGRIFYTIDQSYLNAGYLAQPLWAAEQGWKIQGLHGLAEFWNDPNQPGAANRRVQAGFIDGAGGAAARVNAIGCRDICTMTFEPAGYLWNTTMELRDDSWLDFVGVATHEFGHWHGLRHVTRHDTPENIRGTTNGRYADSDNGANPTMEGPAEIPNAKYMRTIQADDVNGFRAARHGTTTDIAANGSFDHASPGWGGAHGMGWGFRRGGNGTTGSSARYCSGAVHGPCFIEFNGGGAVQSSLYQDIFSWNGNWISGRAMTPRARLRSPVFTSSVSVVVWAMETVPATAVYSRTCTLPPGQWIELSSTASACAGQVSFAEPTNSSWMRLEIYNNHTNHNLDVDNVRLEV